MALRSLLAVLLVSLPLTAQVFKLNKDQLTALTAKNPFERFEDGRPKVPDALLAKVYGLSLEEAWGPMNGDPNYKNTYEGGWHILHPDKKLVGRAVTAQFMPLRLELNELLLADMKKLAFKSAAHQWVIDQLQPGDVLVVDLFGKADGGAVVGDNLATAIKAATKTGGLIVDGAIRDLEGIYPIEMGVYYRHAHPAAIANVQLTGYNVPIRIGQAAVMPGDAILGDREGVYFIPPAMLKTIVDRAEETHVHDEWTKNKFMTEKWKSSELYPRPKDPAVLKEYEEYKAKKLGNK